MEEESRSSCCCGGNCTPENMQVAEEEKSKMGVKILGGGCAKCNQLEAATIEALTELGMDTAIEHVKDYEKIEKKDFLPYYADLSFVSPKTNFCL